MSKQIDSDALYRVVLETLTNNYTVNLFSSLDRENLAKKVSYKVDVMLGKSELDDNTVTTHMGDQIIQRENKTDDLITKDKAEEIEKLEKKNKKVKKVVKRNTPLQVKKKVQSETEKNKTGLSNLKK